MNWLRMSMLILLPTLLNFSGGCDKTSPSSSISIKSKFTPVNVPIQRKTGEKFDLVLPANPSTGNSWKLAEPVDGKILRLVGSTFKTSGPQTPGKSGEDHWTFQTVGKGKTTIKLIYLRQGEKNAASARKVTFNVVVE